VTAWDTGSLDAVTHVTGLSIEERHGSIALSRNGSRLLLAWSKDLDSVQPTDVSAFDDYSRRLSVWSLPDGSRRHDDSRVDPYWPGAVPLGDGLDGPLALQRTSVVGLVLPRAGESAPLRRLTDADSAGTHFGNGALMDRLCTLLADPENDHAVRNLVPQDAYGENLCPS
jgi:hypothetical protein